MDATTTEEQDRRPADGAGADDRRAHLRGMWAAVAGSWSEHAEFVDTRHAENATTMLDLTEPRPGDRVLELACGAGGVGLSAAARVAPGGTVVLSDVVPAMTAIAAARAAALGLTNVSARELDLERIDEPDAAYDVVLCRDGLQFALDPGLAAREMARVLRPGGRFAVAVWGPRELNPWLGVVFDAVSAQIGKPLPPPGLPGPFSLSDPAELIGLFSDAGLTDARLLELPVPMHAASFEDWWARTSALAGPLARLLATMPDAALTAIRARLREAVIPYETPTGYEFPGLALIASGRRA